MNVLVYMGVHIAVCLVLVQDFIHKKTGKNELGLVPVFFFSQEVLTFYTYEKNAEADELVPVSQSRRGSWPNLLFISYRRASARCQVPGRGA
jgi:hypothetical protein